MRRIETLFMSPDFYTQHGERAAQLTAELDSARSEVERLYARWHELEEKKSSLST